MASRGLINTARALISNAFPRPRRYNPTPLFQLALNPGTRLGPYEITELLGVGGMGEVYRATDTNLKRQVAIKVLPVAVAGDPERLARFQREAEVLAVLNHPNIAHIYGLEKSDGTVALVMELVEGDDLAHRISRGAIAVDEALTIARQIAQALEAAHDQGFVHRDLKPANIKIRPDGVVKVLDFGLAKASEAVVSRVNAAASPTVTSPPNLTGMGIIVGTAAYMSPEQAKGRPADKRSDIWAFGVVLYEMLTGTRAFDGEDVVDVLGAVTRVEPNWQLFSADVPALIRALVQNCLIKDQRRRLSSISSALFVLDQATSVGAPVETERVRALSRRLRWHRLLTLVFGVVGVAVIAGTVVAWRATRSEQPRISRLLVASSGASALTRIGNDINLAITPDGTRLIYVGNNGTQLFVRALDTLTPVAVFTGAPTGPFVSPDGQWIGFVDNLYTLKKVPVTGGPAVTLATFDSPVSLGGATWLSEETIIVATQVGLEQVNAGMAAKPAMLTQAREQGDANHFRPERLPGGQAVLFTTMSLRSLVASRNEIPNSLRASDLFDIAVLDLRNMTRKVLVRGGIHARYVPSGHLIYTKAGTIWAIAFDINRLETRGNAVSVVSDVVSSSRLGVNAVVADNGTLAYLSGNGVDADSPRSLVWVDRDGHETAIPAEPHGYLYPRLSPDGTRAAVFSQDHVRNLWVWDFRRESLKQETSSSPPGPDFVPVWTAEGPMLEPTASGRREETSPDGRWVAYETSESGRIEIDVRRSSQAKREHWQVSTAGGMRPHWARNSLELFYVSPTGELMRVGVQQGRSWTATSPAPIVKAGGYVLNPTDHPGPTYDIAPDGQKFLMIKDSNADRITPPGSVVIVLNWLEELKRLAPTK